MNTDSSLIKDWLGSVQPSYAYGTATGSGEQTSPGGDFATYWKDSSTGFEYGMNRYYSTGYGRFLTVDPFGGSASPRSPLSWNRYSYVLGDPVNTRDRSGLDAEDCIADPYLCEDEDSSSGGYCPIGPGFAGAFDPGDDGVGSVGGVDFGGIPGLAPCGVAIVPVSQGGSPGIKCDIDPLGESAVFNGDPILHTLVALRSEIGSGPISTIYIEAGPISKVTGGMSNGENSWLNILDIANPSSKAYPNPAGVLYSTGFSSSNCPEGVKVAVNASRFPEDYYTYGGVSAPNSNPFAYTLLRMSGVSVSAWLTALLESPPIFLSPLPLPTAPGWGVYMPW